MAESAVKVREIFSILTQGIQITEYNVDPKTKKSTILSKLLWLDADIFRICIDTSRPSIADRVNGKIPPGLYLRDISEVRSGSVSFHFQQASTPPQDDEHCLSIIGTERTISIEYPSKFTREWFLQRFDLLSEDIAMEEERHARRFRTHKEYFGQPSHAEVANHMSQLLTRGVQVTSHRRDGKILPAALSFDSQSKELVLQTPLRSYFNAITIDVMRVSIQDISELRPGCHSMGFVKTKSTREHSTTFSIVSSAWVLDIQVINQAARDLFVEKLFIFIMALRPGAPALHTPVQTPTHTPSAKLRGPSLINPNTSVVASRAPGRGLTLGGAAANMDEDDGIEDGAAIEAIEVGEVSIDVEEEAKVTSNLDDVIAEEKREEAQQEGAVVSTNDMELSLGET